MTGIELLEQMRFERVRLERVSIELTAERKSIEALVERLERLGAVQQATDEPDASTRSEGSLGTVNRESA